MFHLRLNSTFYSAYPNIFNFTEVIFDVPLRKGRKLLITNMILIFLVNNFKSVLYRSIKQYVFLYTIDIKCLKENYITLLFKFLSNQRHTRGCPV